MDSFSFASPGDAPTPQPQLSQALASAAQPPSPSPAKQELEPEPTPELAPEPICAAEDLDFVTREVLDFVSSAANQRAFADYRFGRLYMLPKGGDHFNDAPALAAVAGAWPTTITAYLGMTADDLPAVTGVALVYPQLRLEHGAMRSHRSVHTMLDADERIAAVRTWNTVDGFDTLIQLAVRIVNAHSGLGEWRTLGHGKLHEDYFELCAPPGFAGLKGFHGAAGGAIDSLGPIWGR